MAVSSLSSETKRAVSSIISSIIESNVVEKDGLFLNLNAKDYCKLLMNKQHLKPKSIIVEIQDEEEIHVKLVISIEKMLDIRKEIEILQKQIIDEVKLLTGYHIKNFDVLVYKLII